ncbi:hypothetical protein EZMO1_3813 [Endozoicomonas montiporae CL-33]|nr:hypothetical protein EZMO1_3813 [Endozoicomonas montiporae CL-33]
MKTIAFLLASGLSTPLFAASLTFDDQTKDVPDTFGFSGRGAGFVGNPLQFFNKVDGKTFRIVPLTKEGVKIPYNTTVQLQDANNDQDPTYEPYPTGSIGWAADNEDVEHPTYRFDIFAGGKFYFRPEMLYEMIVEINGKEIGRKKTDINSNWDPLTLHKVPFDNNSVLKVTLKPIASDDIIMRHHEDQKIKYGEIIEQDTVLPEQQDTVLPEQQDTALPEQQKGKSEL